MKLDPNADGAGAPPQPAPTPVVDAAAIAKQAAAQVQAEIAKTHNELSQKTDQRLKAAARVLSGEPEAPNGDAILEGLLKDPVKTLRTVADVSKREAKEEIRAERAQEDAIIRTEREVVGPMLKEYPGLKTESNSAAVEMIARRLASSGVSYAEALKTACEKVVKDNNLKSVADAQREGDANRTSLPGSGGGYFGGGAPQRDEGKSVSDFMSNLKARQQSFKQKK